MGIFTRKPSELSDLPTALKEEVGNPIDCAVRILKLVGATDDELYRQLQQAADGQNTPVKLIAEGLEMQLAYTTKRVMGGHREIQNVDRALRSGQPVEWSHWAAAVASVYDWDFAKRCPSHLL